MCRADVTDGRRHGTSDGGRILPVFGVAVGLGNHSHITDFEGFVRTSLCRARPRQRSIERDAAVWKSVEGEGVAWL